MTFPSLKCAVCCMALLSMLACGKPAETATTEDTTKVIDDPEAALGDDEKKGAELLTRFLQDFETAKDSYPSVTFSRHNEYVNYNVHYYFEDDYLVWVQIESSEEGGVAENRLIHKDPEGTTYLHYGRDMDGAFGYEGMDGGEWYAVKADRDYNPYISGPGAAEKFDYETEYGTAMKEILEKKTNFKLKDGTYSHTYTQDVNENTLQFSEVLFNSNLFSATSFNPDMIKGYLNWWYPLYEDTSGKLFRHKLCTGDEDYIKLTVEAGNYRWEELLSGKTLVYSIVGFEESEGDAFYATIERNGSRLKKTLIITENENEKGRLLIDGRVYTSEPASYDYITLKCD